MPVKQLVRDALERVHLRAPLVEVRNWVTRPDWWQHDRRADRFFRQFFAPGELIFDIGAHRGGLSERFLRLGARVIACEPQPACQQHLRERFAHVPHRVTLVPKAVGDFEGSVEMAIAVGSQVSSCNPDWPARYAGQQWTQRIDVAVTTLESLIEQFGRPVFCKIDVEGFEPQVLAGLRTPIHALSLEFTPAMPNNTQRCLERLRVLGYTSMNYAVHATHAFALPQHVTIEQGMELMRSLPAEHIGGDMYAFHAARG